MISLLIYDKCMISRDTRFSDEDEGNPSICRVRLRNDADTIVFRVCCLVKSPVAWPAQI